MATTFRADTRAGLVTMGEAFVAANPTMLRKMHAVRPTSFAGDIPFAYAELLAEAATHTAGTRERVLSPSIVLVGRPLDNEQSVSEFDALVDAFADHATSYAQFSANSIWDQWTVTDESEEVQTAPDSVRTYPTVRFTFTNVSLREGRA